MRSIPIRLMAVLVFAPVGVLAIARIPSHVVSTSQRRDPVYAGLVGQWQGTVEVPDACDTTRRVKRQTRVRVSPAPASDALDMHFTTKDGPGRTVTDTDRLQLDKALTAAEWGGMGGDVLKHYDVYVADSLARNSPLRLVLERERGGNDTPATIRETLTIAPGEIRIVQERRMYGGEFEFQREYVLRRVG
ncbi:MAG: hypothetical protein IPP90_06610 [Gemmatimonadaceae bacterium]|nr:hypothetical protein [Gemmatimonadaceae bacterium]